MGTDQTFYVGPIVKCKLYQRKVKIKYIACPKECRKFITGKFCSDCGSQVEDFEKASTEFGPGSYDLQEKISERLYTIPGNRSGFEYWLPNRDWGSTTSISIGKYDELDPKAISAEEIVEDLVRFKEFFAKELKVLEKGYKGKIEVYWGVTSWCW